MAPDTNSIQRASTPVDSGRSSPVNPRLRQREDDAFAKQDKGYRRYASTIERVLSLFDTALEEWADYPSFLGRLLKALQTKPAGIVEIPHKALVAKRLSQCLNPVLPSGVHQRTLEVYEYIFTTLGKDGLSTDLSYYLPGLTPVLGFASLSVKPTILTLFESHILALEPRSLRPALKAIMLALLPGLEEESSEEFDRTLKILNALKYSIGYEDGKGSSQEASSGDQYFWQCLFLASITSATRRPGALAYLIRNIPKLGDNQLREASVPRNSVLQLAIDAVASPEPGLLIRCFCAGLSDERLLIQRGYLDLLVTHLPLHSTVLQEKVLSNDLERLISAASSVVARRDMSLNRRLWSWFLGPEIAAEVAGAGASLPTSPRSDIPMTPGQNSLDLQSRYFERYGLAPLVRSIHSMIDRGAQNPVERARPLRICLSLMDRWEIGGLVVPRIFLPALRSVWQYQNTARSREASTEVLRSAKMFFDGVESGLIWAELLKVITHALNYKGVDVSEACDLLQLALFVVMNFNLREEEMLVVHIPLMCLVILLRTQPFMEDANKRPLNGQAQLLRLAFKIGNRLLELVPARAFEAELSSRAKDGAHGEAELVYKEDQLLFIIEQFYFHNQGNLDKESSPLSSQNLGHVLLKNSFNLVASMMSPRCSSSNIDSDGAIAMLNQLIRKTPKTSVPDLKAFALSLLNEEYIIVPESKRQVSFAATAAKVSALEAMYNVSPSLDWIPKSVVRQLFASLVVELWSSLSPSRPKHNVEASRNIWRLQAMSADKQLVESTITTLMTANPSTGAAGFSEVESARRFAVLWTHSSSTSSMIQNRISSSERNGNDGEIEKDFRSELAILERPLFLFLDVLEDPKSILFTFVVNWLQSLSSLNMIMKMLIDRLSKLPCVVQALSDGVGKENTDTIHALGDSDDFDVCLYYLQSISNVISCCANNVWPALVSPLGESAKKDNTFGPRSPGLAEPGTSDPGEAQPAMNNQKRLANICFKLLVRRPPDSKISNQDMEFRRHQAALSLLQSFLLGPSPSSVMEMSLEVPLLEELISSVHRAEFSLQASLMEVIIAALKSRVASEVLTHTPKRLQPPSRDKQRVSSNLSITTEGGDRKLAGPASPMLPSRLLHCLILGLTSRNSRPVLESWIAFLHHCLPMYAENVFQILIPLIECFCNTLGSVFKSLQATFTTSIDENTDVFEPTLALLLNGLEQSLATAHDRLTVDEVGSTPLKSPEQQQPQGFFGNMVSGVFTSETNRSKTMTANNRLTVLLCFKDAVRACFAIWSWDESGVDSTTQDPTASASFNYTTLRLRNRTRRIFEHLFAAEALESLETLIEMWQSFMKEENAAGSKGVLNLLQVLEASRPKNAIPAIFNSIYSRTNPAALDPARKSTLTSNLSDTNLATFLVAYTRNLDDDAMDEIWSDCMTFLKDVLANPLPHRQTLPRLLEFTAVLGEKVDRTTFGEQRKMRRELGDLFIRLLTATLTIRPMGFSHEVSTPLLEKNAIDTNTARGSLENRVATGSDGLIAVLAIIIPNISKVLIDSDRAAFVTTTISAQVIGPTFRSKAFPENVTSRTLDLMQALGNVPEVSKAWKKDVAEAFNDSKFFSSSLSLVEEGWVPIIRQWILADKERMPELLSRLSSPTSAGIMFGVGATSARLEADRKTQLNLRRTAFLILAAAKDTFDVNIPALQEKLIDLMNATAASSPSSNTRAEIYMVIRALVLQTTAIRLSSTWPAINAELIDAITSAFPAQTTDGINATCLLQACKLLDVLLTLGPDDFQMQEWLFITDTTDAVYRPANLQSVALIDAMSEGLDSSTENSNGTHNQIFTLPHSKKRGPLLTSSITAGIAKEHIMDRIIRPFFRQLSIYAFESTYSMEVPDWKACFDDLVIDLFDDKTLV